MRGAPFPVHDLADVDSRLAAGLMRILPAQGRSVVIDQESQMRQSATAQAMAGVNQLRHSRLIAC
jgi:hypothetical protein